LHSLRREKDQTMNSDIAGGSPDGAGSLMLQIAASAQKLLLSNGGAAP